MKTIKHILLITLITTFAFSCKNEKNPEVKTVEVETEVAKEIDPNATFAKAEFTIDGMTCQIGCAATIQKKISKMDGVKSATVDFDKKLAMVEYNEAKVTPTTLEEAVAKVSETYKVSDMKTVENFSTKKACSADCEKACCANKDKKTCKPGCEKACCKDGAKTDEKVACKADCKKACCAAKEA
ncbi:heavy metal transporter [Algibacter marinivivus]|uniref:Heavy metal transporter n=1 Tax=Algibacter marinivivus TaxID=2100723 RepID=A0A2U2X7C1_9FLAO|nr:heavy metal-associated domain-containing protein [Algibacter marinivivus]PWH83653.1 heavy metal transporter [Algibacter marinivivus]